MELNARDVGSGSIAQPEGAAWTQQTAWRLSNAPILQIEGVDTDVEHGPVDPVTVFRLRDGRYGVADGDQSGHHAILIYDAQGRFVMRLGRKGRGPGEFGQLFAWGGAYRGDSIAAYDFIDHAIEIFAPNGRHARALKLPDVPPKQTPPQGTFGASDVFIGALADGRVLRFERSTLNISRGPGPVWYEPDVVLYDADGANPRKLATLRTWGNWWDGKRAVSNHYQAVAVTVAGNSIWYHATGEDFTVRVFDAEGRELRRLSRPYQRQRVANADREAAIKSLAAQLSRGPHARSSAADIEKRLRVEGRFADLKPVIVSLIEDADGNLWVEHYGRRSPSDKASPAPTRWSVFDNRGTFLGELETPASLIVSSITSDQVLGFWQDEFDVEHARVYALTKPARAGN